MAGKKQKNTLVYIFLIGAFLFLINNQLFSTVQPSAPEQTLISFEFYDKDGNIIQLEEPKPKTQLGKLFKNLFKNLGLFAFVIPSGGTALQNVASFQTVVTVDNTGGTNGDFTWNSLSPTGGANGVVCDGSAGCNAASEPATNVCGAAVKSIAAGTSGSFRSACTPIKNMIEKTQPVSFNTQVTASFDTANPKTATKDFQFWSHVIVRTNVVTSSCSGYNPDGDNWITYDMNKNGIIQDDESFGETTGACSTEGWICGTSASTETVKAPGSCDLFVRTPANDVCPKDLCVCASSGTYPRRYCNTDADKCTTGHPDAIDTNANSIPDCREVIPVDSYTLANKETYNTLACIDSIKDFDETDIDCGGPTCTANCRVGGSCNINGDCLNSLCISNICAAIYPTDDLFLRFKMDTVPAGGPVPDDSGYNNNGTFVGALINCDAAGHIGTDKACQFYGSASYINVKTTLRNTTQISNETFAAWIMPLGISTVTTHPGIVSRGITKTMQTALITNYTNTGFQCHALFTDMVGNNFTYYGGIGSVSYGVWSHVACVIESTKMVSSQYINITMKNYLNGKLVNTRFIPNISKYTYNADATRIATRLSLLTTFNGTIDEAAVWNRSLSAQEICNIYHNTSGSAQCP